MLLVLSSVKSFALVLSELHQALLQHTEAEPQGSTELKNLDSQDLRMEKINLIQFTIETL